VIDPSARIYPSADLERDVRVGTGSSVWHRAQVRAGVRIGAECIVGRDAFIDEAVYDGRNSLRGLALPEDIAFVGAGLQAATRSGPASAEPPRSS
jgi:UDP-2-acetamido-3-amino-2,3-dideoxy-glucuronate N-acetyltransferase